MEILVPMVFDILGLVVTFFGLVSIFFRASGFGLTYQQPGTFEIKTLLADKN